MDGAVGSAGQQQTGLLRVDGKIKRAVPSFRYGEIMRLMTHRHSQCHRAAYTPSAEAVGYHRLHRGIVGVRTVIGELTEDHGLNAPEHACKVESGEHPFHLINLLSNILKE